MVDINQVPVSLPLGHDLWTYSTGPHISMNICSGHPPHIAQPQTTNRTVPFMYSQPFAQTCGLGGHFGGFAQAPAPMAVQQPHQAHYHHHHHHHPAAHHAHLAQQRADGLDSLDHTSPSQLHVSSLAAAHIHSQPQLAQISPPQPIFISAESRAANQVELLHRTVRTIGAARRNFTRFHWAPAQHVNHPHAHPPHPHARPHPPHRHTIQHPPMGPHQATPMPLQTPSAYSGILLNFL
jgi:E3 ubiquitin-protein ligase RNF38/44